MRTAKTVQPLYTLGIACLCVALALSCRIPLLDTGVSGADRPSGSILLRIADAQGGSRTILPPAVDMSLLVRFTLTLTNGPTTLERPLPADLSLVVTDIPVGEWSLDLQGYDASDVKLAEGHASAVVSASPVSVTLNLEPTSAVGVMGSMRVSFDYTGDAATIGAYTAGSTVTLTQYPAGEVIALSADEVNSANFASDTRLIIAKTNLEPGTYLLSIVLSNLAPAVQHPAITRLVRISSMLCSSADIVITDADLTQPPAAPSNLHISAYSPTSGQITLSWDDNSDTETGFLFTHDSDSVVVPGGQNTYVMNAPSTNNTFTVCAQGAYGDSASLSISYVALSTITLDKASVTLGAGGSDTITATLSPANASLAPFLSWEISNPASGSIAATTVSTVATVSSAASPNQFTSIRAYFATVAAEIPLSIFAGQGTSSDPFQISSRDGLNAVRYAPAAFYRQTAMVDMLNAPWEPIGTSDKPFIGNYDGNGQSVKNLITGVPSDGQQPRGLFGMVNGATIRNLQVENTGANLVQGTENVGMLAGIVGGNALIVDCHASGTVLAIVSDAIPPDSVGGLIGSVESGTIRDCSAAVKVSARETDNGTKAGGLIGELGNLTTLVERCYATGPVEARNYAGGLIGSIAPGSSATATVSECFATGNVRTGASGTKAGGMIGSTSTGRPGNNITVQNCYATGNVSAITNAGGFIGNAEKATIQNAWSAGSASASSLVGGFSGQTTSATLVNLYWDKTTSGNMVSVAGSGFFSYDMLNPAKTTALPAAVWAPANGTSYPYLRWQDTALVAKPRPVPVAWYKLDGDSNSYGTLPEWNGPFNNGNYTTNVPAQVPYANAAVFNGVSSAIRLSTRDLLFGDSTMNLSFSAWVFVDPTGGNYQMLFSNQNGVNTVSGISLYVDKLTYSPNIRLVAVVGDNSTESKITHPENLPANGWCHVVLAIQADQTVTMYVNDIQHSSSFSFANYQKIAPLEIGWRPNNSDYFRGYMSDVRFYGHALSAQAVQDMYP